jgi:signal transduction histidine kinase/ligand-binding sensor domain-containing protein
MCAALVFTYAAHSIGALDARKNISQYITETWNAEQGYAGGLVYAFAQTPDGYLWIGTEKGLVRFDGLTFHLLQHSDSAKLSNGPILGLVLDAEGSLWIRGQGPTLLRYRDGVFSDVLAHLPQPETSISAMCVGPTGDILFSTHENGLIRYSQGRFLTLVPTSGLPGLILSLAETADGVVWAGLRQEGLFYLQDGRFVAFGRRLPNNKINSLLASGNNELWVGTDEGIVRWNGQDLFQPPLLSANGQAQVLVMTADREANVWAGTSVGLFRVNTAGVAQETSKADDEPAAVTALLEDREGSLWVGKPQGIERIRDSMFTTYSVASGLPANPGGPLYVDPEGRTWFGPSSGGLYWLQDGRLGKILEDGLPDDVVYSIDGRADELWVGRRRGGLTQIHFRDGSYTIKTYRQSQGLAQDSIYAVHESPDGTVWAGTLSAGLSHLQNGHFTTYTSANSLLSNTVTAIAENADGTIWIATPRGVNSFSRGRWHSYIARDGLPPGDVNCLAADANGTLWIGTASGLVSLNSGVLQVSETAAALHEEIFGIAEDRTGSLWVATARHILQVNPKKLLQRALADSDVREYGLADGLVSTQGVKRFRSVVADPSGRIWLSTSRGLSVVDPQPMGFSSVPALLHVDGVSADGRSFAARDRLRITAPHQRITLSYTALSLAVPQRTRFKYKLDNFDSDWSEPTSNRQAVYTNLDSGAYRFRVIASNSEGLWNSSEATLQFEVEPEFWQTWWFRFSIFLALLLTGALIFRLRIRKLSREWNLRFEERLSERTRIAQDLHDTLLQGLMSASMQLHVADERLAADLPAKPLVRRVLALMDQVGEEGRNAVQGLRSSRDKFSNLEQAFSQLREEFSVRPETEFRVIVTGTPRPPQPIIGYEVFRIGREALSNAFRHSLATDVEVEIEYASSQLRVLVRDNGSGIDPHMLQTGRERHWGLSGMKERTEKIGGSLRVLSHAGAGTEVEVTVPGQIAFAVQSSGRRSRWFSRLFS